jgi:hypothetical protein
MINDNVIEAFNNRLTADMNNIKKMTPAQLDKVKTVGTSAENLMKNRDFAMFIHNFKFEKLDAIGEINGHTPEDNAARIAITQQIAGIDDFIVMLKKAAYIKDRIVSSQQGSEEPSA